MSDIYTGLLGCGDDSGRRGDGAGDVSPYTIIHDEILSIPVGHGKRTGGL